VCGVLTIIRGSVTGRPCFAARILAISNSCHCRFLTDATLICTPHRTAPVEVARQRRGSAPIEWAGRRGVATPCGPMLWAIGARLLTNGAHAQLVRPVVSVDCTGGCAHSRVHACMGVQVGGSLGGRSGLGRALRLR
jgi:hypothetical protein